MLEKNQIVLLPESLHAVACGVQARHFSCATAKRSTEEP
jgi:hypothetical protein